MEYVTGLPSRCERMEYECTYVRMYICIFMYKKNMDFLYLYVFLLHLVFCRYSVSMFVRLC